MNKKPSTGFEGVYAATLCPLKPDYSIDEAAIAGHTSSVATVPGIKGILCNGHAGENFALDRKEKRRVVEITRASVPVGAVIVAGVNQENSLEAAAEAREAAAAGADAVMVFPPNSWGLSLDRGAVLAHHRTVLEAIELPIMLYQAPVNAGRLAYRPGLLRELVALPRVVGIKEGSWETATYEANRRLIKEVAPEVAVMASGDEHLLTCFVLGSEGSLVSLAVVIPETIVALDQAVRRGDLVAARAAHEIIYPLANTIYGAAYGGFPTARLKTCLKLLGRLDCDAMRPPVPALSKEEIGRLREAMERAGVM